MNNNKKKNGVIISVILCTILGGFTFIISYKSSNNKVVSKKNDVVLSDNAILSEEMTKKDHDKEELAMLQGRIVNVMNNAIIGDCKKSTVLDSEKFLQQIPFRQDFDFVTYEANWRENGVDKPIRYAIGLCKKKESPLKGMFCNYDFAKIEKEGAVENTILWKYENNDYKEVYKLKGIDRCATLCDGNIAVVLQCNQNERIYLPFQRLNYGNMQVSYLEDTIKRNVKVMPPVNKDYIKVSKLDMTNDVFGTSEYIVLNQEEKHKIQEELKKNQPITNKAASTAIFHTVTFRMDNKQYECENGFPGQYFMNLIKTRCNFVDYNMEDLKNIKKARLQKYYVNSLQNYDLDKKTVLSKEQTISDSQQLKIILDALKSTSSGEDINSVPDDYNVSILTLTRDNGMEIKMKLSKISSEHKEAAVLMENGYWYKISQSNLKKVYDSFGNIVKKKPIKDLKLNEKTIDTSTSFYLGMPAYGVEKFGFEMNNDFDIESQSGSHYGEDIIFDCGSIKFKAKGKENNKSIYSIEVKDSSITTNAGMKVGNIKGDMEKLYGKTYKTEKLKINGEDITKCIYQYDKNNFEVYIQGDKVKSWCIIKM